MLVWIPMMDEDERASAVTMTRQFDDRDVEEFWDRQRLLGQEVNRNLALEPDHAAWNIYLFYLSQCPRRSLLSTRSYQTACARQRAAAGGPAAQG